MGRIIINNKSKLSDTKVLDYVQRVISMGRISNDDKQYCYLTTFPVDIAISTTLNKGSDSFTIIDSKWRG